MKKGCKEMDESGADSHINWITTVLVMAALITKYPAKCAGTQGYASR